MCTRHDGQVDKKEDGPSLPKIHTHHPLVVLLQHLGNNSSAQNGKAAPSQHQISEGWEGWWDSMQHKVFRIPGAFSHLQPEFKHYLVLCDKRIDFQRLHLLKQYGAVFPPGLPGPWFHDSSDHNFPSVLH